ncbi:Gliding motility regulatory protein [compost metagenome]
MRPLPALVGRLPLVSGAWFDPEGVPQPVIDVAGLIAATPLAAARPHPAPARPPILVVDDSLTTRMLEASILEVAGYDVALAASAEEALELARGRHFGLFVVDVEMPGMTGFEFVELTRGDPALAATPAILVTSRDSESDRQRGVRSGASGYIVKGEFDQDRFLALVGRLMG